MRRSSLFTKEFVLSIGGDDSPETDEMIRVLNLLTIRWGHEALSNMQRFLNIVKSRTDELSVVLSASDVRVAVGGGNNNNSSSSSGSIGGIGGSGGGSNDDTVSVTANHSTTTTKDAEIIKAQANEIDRLRVSLGELEPRFAEIQGELTALKSKCDSLKLIEPDKNKEKLSLLETSYSKKCRELDMNADLTARHFAWYNEQLTTRAGSRNEIDKIVHQKDKEIADLKSRMVTNSLQVLSCIVKYRCMLTNNYYCYVVIVVSQETLHRELMRRDLNEKINQKIIGGLPFMVRLLLLLLSVFLLSLLLLSSQLCIASQ